MRLLLSLVLVLVHVWVQVPAMAQPAPLSREQVQEAVQQLQQDPNLAGTRTQKTLRLINKKDTPPQAPQRLEFWPWLRTLFNWLVETSRLLVWAVGLLLLALCLVGLRHAWRWRGSAARGPLPDLPSHVRDLDIRRESLPADIGAAARALWEQGQARPALSLLYRGALSRLVHTHAVPIRAASTEQECVQLARRALAAERSDFVAQLVQAWLLTVYGQRRPADADVLALCAGFHARLDP